MSNFERSSREKFRFPTNKGLIRDESLWDLPFKSNSNPNLNDVAKALSREIKESAGEDFVSAKTEVNTTLELKLAIVKHVIAVKLAERAEARAADAKAERRRKLLAIKAGRADEADHKLSDAELDAALAE
ncbi:MAG: hypothetical protein QM489_00410 [Candidatus Izemoplasma sp.]